MYKLFVLVLLYLGVVSAHAQRTPDYAAVSPERALNLALQVASPAARVKHERADLLPPLIVFVPGILGSKLKWPGYVFGDDPVDGKKLVFRPDEKPTPATLNDLTIRALDKRVLRRFSRVDVYGKGLDLLQEMNDGRGVDEFSYDWRADIDESARELNAWFLHPSRKGRRVLVLAHSMGGLVVWRWLQLFEGNSRPVVVSHAVFAGSPLQGACETARMLIEGYQAPPGSPILEELVTAAVFSDARASLFTFPSVFQVLPKYERDRACLSMVSNPQIGPAPMDHHNADFWLGVVGRNIGMKANDARVLTGYAGATGLRVDAYEAKVVSAIEAGARFRSNLKLSPPRGVQITYLYSDASPMARSYDIRRDGAGWYEIVAKRSSPENGDGRVLPSSARNDGNNDGERSSLRFALQSVHGALLNDPILAKFVRDTVQSVVQAAVVQALSDLVGEAQVSAALRQGAYIVDPSIDTIYLDSVTTAARRVIARYNARTIAPEGSDDAISLRAWTSSLGKSQGQLESLSRLRLAASLIESSALLDPAGVPQSEARFLTEYRINSGEWKKAYSAARLVEMSRSSDADAKSLWMPLSANGIVSYGPEHTKGAITLNSDAYLQQTLRNSSRSTSTIPGN